MAPSDAASGSATPTPVDGARLDRALPSSGHAADDPIAAVWERLQAALKGAPVPRVLAVIGFGDGALLDTLDRHAPQTRVLALEPDPVSARRFLARPKRDGWHGTGRLLYLAGPDYVGADEAWRIFPTGVIDPPVLTFRASPTSAGADLEAARVLEKILFGVRANDGARRRFAPRYLINSLRNVPAVMAGTDLRVLSGACAGVPAVIAAAGPSLDAVVDDLGRFADHALLIAADTALRPLLAAGVSPQLVVGLDPSATNARHLLSLPECRDTWLVSESALDRQATAAFEGRTFWFRAANHHPWPWFNEFGLDVGRLDVWGSVLTGAFELACLAGCDPIVIVGADLSYTGGRPYARGTTYELEWLRATAMGTAIEDVWGWSVNSGQTVRAPDLRGIDTATTPWLLSFRDWMAARATRSGRRVINATGAGMLFGGGIEHGRLSDVLTRDVAVPSIPALARRLPHVRPSVVAGRLRALRETLTSNGPPGAPLTDWAEFSGDGFDRAAVAGALDEAAYTLETKRGIPTAAAAMPFPPGATTDQRSAFSQLPEAMVRFRAALAGALPLPDVGAATAADGVAALGQARVVFKRIREAVLRSDDLTPLPGAADAPVSLAYDWPEATRCLVEMFEALLGKAWTAAVPRRSAFFTRATSIRRATRTSGAADAVAPRRHAADACALLALQWLRCADGDTSRPTMPASSTDPRTLALVPGVTDALLTRALTGSFQDVAETLRARGVTLDDAGSPGSRSGTRPGGPARAVAPRALTDDTTSRALVAYATPAGVVCLTPQARESVIVGADGVQLCHHTWPRPILGELPFGRDGAVAWGNGMGTWPDVTAAYVMYRRQAGDAVTIELLPVRPTIGMWWNERLYWNCYPTPIDAWTGLVSWAPGEEPRVELSDLTLLGIHPDGDSLVLQPCTFEPMVGWQAESVPHGWKWTPGEPLVPVPLDSAGIWSARETREGWTAVAHPEADLVLFEHADGRSASMTCYYPLRLAWSGPSLFVSTAECELLMFEDLIDALEDSGAPARTTR